MKKLTATVKEKTTGEWSVIERDYFTSKKAFAECLRKNGYVVIRMYSESDKSKGRCEK